MNCRVQTETDRHANTAAVRIDSCGMSCVVDTRLKLHTQILTPTETTTRAKKMSANLSNDVSMVVALEIPASG